MDERPLVKGYIANFGISLDVFSVFPFRIIFLVLYFFCFLYILGPSYCGIGANIRIGRDIQCLPYAGFFLNGNCSLGWEIYPTKYFVSPNLSWPASLCSAGSVNFRNHF